MPLARRPRPDPLVRAAEVLSRDGRAGGGRWLPARPGGLDDLLAGAAPDPDGPPEPEAVGSEARPDSPPAASSLAQALQHSRGTTPVTWPAGLRRARVAVKGSTVLSVVAVVLVVSAVFAVRVLLAERSARPVPVSLSAPSGAPTTPKATSSTAGPTGPQAATSSASAPTSSTGTSSLLVHVAGQVRRPGVVQVSGGARVADALRAAGGPTARADLAAVNLARPVVDGEQVYVPAPGEAVHAVAGGSVPGTAGGGAAGPGGSGGGAGGTVDLNTADLAALDSLPGVGPVLAQRILDWRAQHGRFTAVDELAEVSGIGDKLLARLRDKVKV